MGDANPKINVYNLGSLGVNRVLSPIHKQDGELMQAQNALSGVVSGRDAIKKRWGMTGYNASSFSGPVLSIHTLPFPGFPDPVVTTGSYILWPGLSNQAYAGPTYVPKTAMGVSMWGFGSPPLQASAGVYEFISYNGIGVVAHASVDASDLSTTTYSTASYALNESIFYTRDGVEQILCDGANVSGWKVWVIPSGGGGWTALGARGDVDALITPQTNQVAVGRISSGSIVGMATYTVQPIAWSGSGWVTVGYDLLTTVLSGYGDGTDGQLLSTALAISNNRMLFSIYDNNVLSADVAKLLKSDDAGNTWTVLLTGTVPRGYIDIIYSNIDNDWIIAVQQQATTYDLMVSYNNGDTWATFKQIAIADNPYFYGSRPFGQTTGSYTGAYYDATTGDFVIYEVDGAAGYTVKDTFNDPAFTGFGAVLAPA